jgi:hypothetical protein
MANICQRRTDLARKWSPVRERHEHRNMGGSNTGGSFHKRFFVSLMFVLREL